MAIENFYEYLPAGGTAPESLVILLHGVGSNGRDLISLAPLWANILPKTAFVSPDAPFVCDMVPPGYPDSYQWFSLQNRDPHVMLCGVQTVFPLVEEFIEAQHARFDLPYNKIILVGFSQGTMTALYVAPRLKDTLAGVLGYSGAYLSGPRADDQYKLKKPPLYLVHGDADNVVPVQAWDVAVQTLKSQGFDVGGYTTPGLVHSIDQEGIEKGGAFMRARLVL